MLTIAAGCFFSALLRGLFFSLLFFSPVSVHAETDVIQNEDCLMCHDTLDEQKFASSIHGHNLCTSCHTGITELPHEETLPPVDCASCHAIESEIYYTSDHGMALTHGIKAAACLDCHGKPHEMLDYRNPESPVYRANIPKTCAVCHADTEKMAPYDLSEREPIDSYMDSIHGKTLGEKDGVLSAVCTDCHGSHDLHAPTNPQSKIYRQNVPKTCGKCHENVEKIYERSIHGRSALQGKREAPVCTDCHGEHNIKAFKDPDSTVYGATLSEKTCGHCHAAEKITTKYRLPFDAVETYMDSYHGLASRLGSTTVANCASCHGAHDILPSTDPKSSVYKENLARTCGKCHPGAGEGLTMGTVHVSPGARENNIVFMVSTFYVGLIFVVIGGMLLHNFLDFSYKLKQHYRKNREHGKYLRFTVQQRVQHIILVISFIVLAYTGFALKYPEAWWASPFAFFEGGESWRGIIHKSMAIIFVAIGTYHVGWLLFTRGGRKELKSLAPARQDFRDFFRLQRRNLGFKEEKIQFYRFNYIEKLEYWALVWGAVIMIVTGTILTFENIFMRHLPKWALDVATMVHFYEAVLATLAILVWHFYFVIFDPDQYPLNLSMTTGRVDEHEKRLDDVNPPEERDDKDQGGEKSESQGPST